MNSRKKLLVAWLVAVTAGLCFAWKPIQIWYLRRSLEPEYKHLVSGFDKSDVSTAERQIKERLTELGYFFYNRYEMENVPDDQDAHFALYQLACENFPEVHTPNLSEDNVLEVWDVVERKEDWDLFIARYNTANIVDHYIAGDPSRERGPKNPNLTPATSSVLATDFTGKLVGSWRNPHGDILDIKLVDDQIVLARPKHESHRRDIRDAKIVGKTIQFIEEIHTFSRVLITGSPVVVESTIYLIDENNMRLKTVLEFIPDPSFDEYVRYRSKQD